MFKVPKQIILNMNYLLIVILLFAFTLDSYSQQDDIEQTRPRSRYRLEQEKREKEKNVFPDNYSDLDERGARRNRDKKESFEEAMEQAKQKYYQALILIQKRDTSRAAKYFDLALQKLNEVATIQGVEDNRDFTDLAESIIEDYENYVKNIDFLDENSPIFMIREMLYKEIDKIEALDLAQDESISSIIENKSANFPKLPKGPDSLTIPLDDHVTVQNGIKFLTQGKGKKIFSRWLERSSRWFPMMKRIAAEENVPLEIIYLSMIESGLNATIVSPAKAVGLWQFILTTGQMYNLNKNPSMFLDERREPEKATRAALRHLRDLYREFGDWHLALCAYNCGAGCVGRAVRKSKLKNPTFWDIRNLLPDETKAYVPQYIAAAKIAMDPVSYGFNLDSLNFVPLYEYETVKIDSAVNLAALAKCVNISLDSLKTLNTELTKLCTPPDALPYMLKIPLGTKGLFNKNFPQLTYEEKVPFITHIVKAKESLISIAANYNVNVNELASINKLANANAKLKNGQALTIPITSTYAEAIAKREEIESKSKQEESTSEVINKESVKHTVAKGESLFSIARKYEMDVAELRKLNSLETGSDNVVAGQTLWVKPIPVDATATTISGNTTVTSPTPNPIKYEIIKHKVERGETLAQIADKYGVTMSNLIELNKIKKNSKLLRGTTLKVRIESQSVGSNKITHTVKSGENLSAIALKYKVSEDDLRKWNSQNIKGNTVYANTELTIYTEETQKNISNTETKTDSKTKTKNNTQNPKYYKIKSGDTLIKIARRHGVTVNSILSLNKNLDGDMLIVGKQIRIE